MCQEVLEVISGGTEQRASYNQVRVVIRGKNSNGETIDGGLIRTTPVAHKELHQPDLQLEINDIDSVSTYLVYNSNLFTSSTIERLTKHYNNLLVSILEAGASAPLAELNLFSPLENEWYRQTCNGGSWDPLSRPLHLDIEEHAVNQSDKLAVSDKLQSLTYQELNHKSNQLANFLIGNGVGPESRLIVCLEPSVHIAVTLLAILKAGAVYVPLNPSHPEYRIKTIINDTNPEMVITQSAILKKHDFGGNIRIVELDANKELAGQSNSNPNSTIEPDGTAYIYYTSGTTGMPKGSLGTYSNLNHYIRVSQDKYGFSKADIMPALASYTFSISMFELLSPLVAGGTLRILDLQHILDAKAMVGTLSEVTFVHAGPSLLKQLVKYINRNVDDYSMFSGLRHLSSGGDMVPPDLLRSLQLIFQTTELYVIYGCSEIACMGCTYEIDPVRPVEKTYVGRPFKNVSILLLDKDGNIVPIGVAGEVCIGGNGVASSYLNRPDLTEKKFFTLDGIKYYRTGDVGRLTAAGELELLGREDFQIQIHGMRVELGEVEYHLRQSPGVKDAVVVEKINGPVSNTLVAYYVKKDRYQIGAESLRQHMVQHVPDYMIPSFYVELDALPLNLNNKVDRKRLQNEDIKTSEPVEKPRTESQKALAALWSDLLHKKEVGLYDNFLAIGGDSLLAMEMISKVHETMGVQLDGLSILRESLHVLAGICDTQLGRVVSPDVSASGSLELNSVKPIKSYFFGPDSDLYGLLHLREGLKNDQAVLICPPIGGAYKRCYFLLKILGDQLADSGVPVMRFDYFGTNDSMGEDREATIERWVSDIEHSYEELQRQTGAQVKVLGIRMGALLALKALSKKQVEHWVLWDPVMDGETYYNDLANIMKIKVWRARTLRGLNKPTNNLGVEELVGITFSDLTLKKLRTLNFNSVELSEKTKLFQLLTTGAISNEERDKWSGFFDSNCNELEVNCGWSDSDSFSTAIIDKRILSALEEMLRNGCD
ncbi:MAG: hypothetical protein DHS20C17_14350 [Cyclobacteriaceae bacterium]|nr:MAG: hypothetical protein DHS20C17_14350 [Cyclobacteriaceae bacterium]